LTFNINNIKKGKSFLKNIINFNKPNSLAKKLFSKNMKFLTKQFITTFFSLSLFIISAEAWGASVTQTINNADCATACGEIVAEKCSGGAADIFTITYGTRTFAITCTAANTPAKADLVNICKEAFCEVYAASTSKNTFVKTMCNAFKIVNGSAGKAFAAFAIIATGIGFFSGKVSWGLMIGVAAGIATMFGAPSIVAAISGQTTNLNCDLNAN
jgi:type IV secretory pathway VirB2 component (pilin)